MIRIAITLATAIACASPLAAQSNTQSARPLTAEENLEIARAKFLKAMKPICATRNADLKAGRRPKEFAGFLLSLPVKIRPEVILTCDSM
jgi:hypothetical protein